jgi:hypothetical protein
MSSGSRSEKPAAGLGHLRLRTQAAFNHTPNGERFHHPVTFSQIKSNDSPEFEERQEEISNPLDALSAPRDTPKYRVPATRPQRGLSRQREGMLA